MKHTLRKPEAPPEPEWESYRNSYQSMSGDYEPSDSWTAAKVLRPWMKAGYWRSYEHDSDCVVLRVSVHGRRDHRGKLRASNWSASVVFRGLHESVGGGKCKSVKDATRKADAALADSHAVEDVLARVFSPVRANCVYRWDWKEKRFYPYMSTFPGTYIDTYMSHHHYKDQLVFVQVRYNWRGMGYDFVRGLGCGWTSTGLTSCTDERFSELNKKDFPDWCAAYRPKEN